MKKTEGSVLAPKGAANVGSWHAHARSLLLSMRLLTTCLAAAAIVGCAKDITDGEIVGKEHRSESTVMLMMPLTSCRQINRVSSCHTTLIPMFFHYPERWSVQIKKFDGEKWRRATWWVDREAFDQVTVGGYFETSDAFLNEEPRERVARPANWQAKQVEAE